jgi:hypothetical protein
MTTQRSYHSICSAHDSPYAVLDACNATCEQSPLNENTPPSNDVCVCE